MCLSSCLIRLNCTEKTLIETFRVQLLSTYYVSWPKAAYPAKSRLSPSDFPYPTPPIPYTTPSSYLQLSLCLRLLEHRLHFRSLPRV